MPTGTQAKGPQTPRKRTRSRRNEKPQATSLPRKAGSASTAAQAGRAGGGQGASTCFPRPPQGQRGTEGTQSPAEPRRAPTHSSGLPRPPRLCRAERPRQARLLRFSCFLKENKIHGERLPAKHVRHNDTDLANGHTVTPSRSVTATWSRGHRHAVPTAPPRPRVAKAGREPGRCPGDKTPLEFQSRPSFDGN